MEEIEDNSKLGVNEAKDKLSKGKTSWDEHAEKINKMKHENALNLQNDDLRDETDIKKSKSEKILKLLKKTIKRNRDFKCL